MVIKPLFDNIVVDETKKEEKTNSGFILPGASGEKYTVATVTAVGLGGKLYGNDIVINVKVGDQVLYPTNSGTKVKVDGNEFTLIKQSDILAIIE